MYSCPVCDHLKSPLRYRLTFNVHKCGKCGFEFCPDAKFNESFSSSLDEEVREKALVNLRKENFEKIIHSIKSHKKDDFRGLEVGPGYGWFLEICKEHSIDCMGIEPETRFNKDYQMNGLEVVNGFFPEGLPKGSKFAFITYNDVLEHLPDLNTIMSANHALLKEKGLLLVNLPIQSGLIYFMAKLGYRFGLKSILNRMWQFNFHSPHMSYFRKKNLIDLVTKHNFEHIDGYKLKTINLCEISDRIKQDGQQHWVKRFITKIGVLILFPFLNIFPDTYCFVFEKQ